MQKSKQFTNFAIPKLNSGCASSRADIFALCMVAAVETPARQLLRPRTPKQRAFYIPNSIDMANFKNEAAKAAQVESMADLLKNYLEARWEMKRCRDALTDHLMENDLYSELWQFVITLMQDGLTPSGLQG